MRKGSRSYATYQAPEPPPAVSRESILGKFLLSTYQQAICDKVPDGRHLIIRARAGTGKTSSIEQLVARFAPNIDAIVCAFSNEIKKELERRLWGLARIVTTYGLGFQAVKRFFPGFRFDVDQQDWKYKDLCLSEAKLIQGEMAFSARYKEKLSEWEIASPLIRLVRQCQLSLTDPLDIEALDLLADKFSIILPLPIERISPHVLSILSRGKESAARGEKVSFTDMIWLPFVYNMPIEQASKVLVDEAQDLSNAQRSIVIKACREGGQLIFVGDEKQSCFGFAGADSDSMDNIARDTQPDHLPLNLCYRCPKTVIELAQGLVPEIEAAPDAPDGIIEHVGYSKLHEMVKGGDMLLCRKTAPLIKTCLHFISHRIKAHVRGREIAAGLCATIDAISSATYDIPFTYAKFGYFLEEFCNRQIEKITGSGRNAESKIRYIQDQQDALQVCFENFTNCKDTRCLIDEIKSIFSDDKDGVILSTIHRAKGLESPRVFILEPESLPMVWRGQREWERVQELNLEYIAYTRVQYKRDRATGEVTHQGELYFVESNC